MSKSRIKRENMQSGRPMDHGLDKFQNTVETVKESFRQWDKNTEPKPQGDWNKFETPEAEKKQERGQSKKDQGPTMHDLFPEPSSD